jgi:hypothetical protein
MAIKYKTLLEDYRKLGTEEGTRHVREYFTRPENRNDRLSFDFGRLFEECFGSRAFQKCRGRNPDRLANQVLTEDADGVTSAAFQNITGQILYSAVLESYQSEEFVFTKMIPEMQSPYSMPEKIGGITDIGDKALIRPENAAYPVAGVNENWIYAPGTDDRGFAITVTREAIFDDRTGKLMENVGKQAFYLGLNVEKRAIDCVIDLNGTAVSAMSNGHRYYWKDNSIATYGDNSGTHSWDNLSASTSLISWESLQTVELLLAAITDPHTGEPIQIQPKHLIVCPDLVQTGKQIVSATEIRKAVGGYATSGNLTTQVSPNTATNYEIVSSRLLKARQVTAGGGLATTWYLGNIGEAFRRKVNWPLEVRQAAAGNEAEIMRQIVFMGAANERSSFFTYEPRVMAKATA